MAGINNTLNGNTLLASAGSSAGAPAVDTGVQRTIVHALPASLIERTKVNGPGTSTQPFFAGVTDVKYDGVALDA